MKRRTLLQGAGAVGAALGVRRAGAAPAAAASSRRRVRPSDPAWPDDVAWQALKRQVGGRLMPIASPLLACASDADACARVFAALRNPSYVADNPALTQTSGWADAWTAAPSAYAVAASRTADVVAAVNFARSRNLRLVIKGGGHSYQGTSNAADSLLIWMRPMNAIVLEDAFVADQCSTATQPAVTVEAGALWVDVHDAVTTHAGRYVQGGGCGTVGVAGLIQSGGFGGFSKTYGLAAAALLQAEIVTADGAVRIANECVNPELYWALKGGGGGSLGVVTRVTLRTRDLPDGVGTVRLTLKAASDQGFRHLIERFVGFYADRLFNRHWGDSVRFGGDNALDVTMVFQGLDQAQARAAWQPFLDWAAGAPGIALAAPVQIAAGPAPGLPDRPHGADADTVGSANPTEAGWYVHGYASAWLPAALLGPTRRQDLADALFAASRSKLVALHVSKGLAGAPAEAIAAARDTAMNPAVLDAFALAICAGGGPAAFPGLPGHEPDLPAARRDAAAVGRAMDALRALAPGGGSYLAESDYFERDWQTAFWGANRGRLAAVKQRYDPDGLFFVHHGIGSDEWSMDGFERRT
jgi:FAD/FMN-containing dehydrogenase